MRWQQWVLVALIAFAAWPQILLARRGRTSGVALVFLVIAVSCLAATWVIR